MIKKKSDDHASWISRLLLETGAVRLQPARPFTWASGWKSPIYCDNRLTLSYPEVRKEIKNTLVQMVSNRFPEAESIAGVATAGIPQGALIADALDLPFLYVRSKPKGHGMENLIEGKITPGQKAVVIEDLISTGGSSVKAVEALRKSGFDVLGLVAIFTYGFQQAEEHFKNAGIEFYTLSNYKVLINEAVKSGYIHQDDEKLLKSWRKDPAGWGK
jgi:orotate phosphoribosyltransferase